MNFQSASDMVLADDNFASIVAVNFIYACKVGRFLSYILLCDSNFSTLSRLLLRGGLYITTQGNSSDT